MSEEESGWWLHEGVPESSKHATRPPFPCSLYRLSEVCPEFCGCPCAPVLSILRQIRRCYCWTAGANEVKQSFAKSTLVRIKEGFPTSAIRSPKLYDFKQYPLHFNPLNSLPSTYSSAFWFVLLVRDTSRQQEEVVFRQKLVHKE